jgi:hypothetical protein
MQLYSTYISLQAREYRHLEWPRQKLGKGQLIPKTPAVNACCQRPLSGTKGRSLTRNSRLLHCLGFLFVTVTKIIRHFFHYEESGHV